MSKSIAINVECACSFLVYIGNILTRNKVILEQLYSRGLISLNLVRGVLGFLI